MILKWEKVYKDSLSSTDGVTWVIRLDKGASFTSFDSNDPTNTFV